MHTYTTRGAHATDVPEAQVHRSRLQPARSAILIGKLSPPLESGFEIQRTQVCEQIFGRGSARLVLLRAPAGFGKTTVMLQLHKRFADSGVPRAWLTLDSADNDIARFLTGLRAVLLPLIPALECVDTLDISGIDELAFTIINTVAAHPVPFVLFLDDFEHVQNPAVTALVRELIETLPRGAQLILGSRGVPQLGLGRMRTRGKLLEIDPAQLRFSESEVEGFLCTKRQLKLDRKDIRRLHRVTEGWPAALWLASITLENQENPSRVIQSFSGSNVAVVDYLVEDVLARQSDEVRMFLLRTSVLSQLNPSICDAVLGCSNSAQLLRQLELSHLFLVPLGNEREFRYHGMFAQFLRTQLERQLPAEIPHLHRAAAEWYLQQGRPVPAIEHALATGDMAFALPLLHAHARDLLDQGRVRLLSRWLDPLVEANHLARYPSLRVVHAWAVCLAHGPQAAAPLLEQLEPLVAGDAELTAHCQAMRPLLLVLRDRIEEALPLTEALLAGQPSGVPVVRGFLQVVLANLAMIAGRYHEALRLVDAARSHQPIQYSSFNLALSEAAEGAVNLTQGRLRKAIAKLRLAVSAGLADPTRTTNGNAMAGVLLAEALYEADQCEQAERLLAVYVPLIRSVGIPDQLITAHIVLARIASEQGDHDRAMQLLAELEHIGHRDGLPRVVASARLERVRFLVVENRLDRARAELERCDDASLWARVSRLSLRANEVENYQVAVARWSIASGQALAVIDGLKQETDSADRAQRERRALTLRLLLAQAYYRLNERNKAMRVLAEAVHMAALEGYVRAFRDEGELVLAMIRKIREMPEGLCDGTGNDQTTIGFIDTLLRQPHTGLATEPTVPVIPTSEILTRKEIQTLRLAAEGLSNEQIAQRMFVAETTVRTHLRNINVKLDTRNRMEAIAWARRAALIA